jgi:hypothetical protein
MRYRRAGVIADAEAEDGAGARMLEIGDEAERVCTGDELRLDVASILEAGGLFPYARKVGMLKG